MTMAPPIPNASMAPSAPAPAIQTPVRATHDQPTIAPNASASTWRLLMTRMNALSGKSILNWRFWFREEKRPRAGAFVSTHKVASATVFYFSALTLNF
jgi:hypothetical protein